MSLIWRYRVFVYLWFNINDMWANFHSHNKYCDGKGELGDFVDAAKKQNVFSIGFSCHGPLPFENKWAMNEEDIPKYYQDIAQLRLLHPDLEIYKSLELDFIPGVISPSKYKQELDYLLGSIHFVDKYADGTPFEIDGPHEGFKTGIEKIFKNDVKAAIIRYYELTREMIFGAAPDIIGHLDKIKIQNQGTTTFDENSSWYKEAVMKTIKLIDQAELIVEVNTRGLYQKKSSTTYPSPWILEIMQKRNMPITISSDAHVAEDLTNQFPQTAKLLHNLGFRILSVLTEGRWQQLPFNENGIVR